jgi:hypothetical protein
MSDMAARYPSTFRIAMVSIVFLIGGCSDLGDPVPPPLLSVSQRNPQIASGETLIITIAGGTPPFTLLDKGDSTKVRASIVGNSLTIHALAAGNSSIVVGDNGSPRQSITVRVTVVLFAVGQSSFTLFVGDSATTTLSGGTQPYSFVSKGDTTRVRASISGLTMNLRAIAAGGSTIIVGDNSLPQLTVTVGVNVTSPVSFSGEVQPIFTTNCVDAGSGEWRTVSALSRCKLRWTCQRASDQRSLRRHVARKTILCRFERLISSHHRNVRISNAVGRYSAFGC